jgi:hypothetical protein
MAIERERERERTFSCRMQTVASLTLTPDEKTEKAVHLYGRHDPDLKLFENVDKLLKEGARERQELLSGFMQLLDYLEQLLARSGVDDEDLAFAKDVLKMRPDMLTLERELKIILRAQNLNKKHDEL